MTTRTELSIEEFLAGDWPADTQLVDGEVCMNDPGFRHQKIASRLHLALGAWVQAAERRGITGWGGNWTLAPGQVYKPDVWWTAEAAQPSDDAIRSDDPPTLAIEVRSPGTWHLDRGRKRDVYEVAGVAELWLVDTPARTVLVSRRSDAGATLFDITEELGPGDTLVSPLLGGFSQPIDDLFVD
jgi:Uma2 family endonuclease